MNPFGWKKWKEVPYRGDGFSKNFKSRRRKVNLIKQRRDLAISAVIILIIFACAIVPIIGNQDMKDNNTNFAGFVIGSILLLTLMVGIYSLTNFRRGYDVDISDEEDKDNESNT